MFDADNSYEDNMDYDVFPNEDTCGYHPDADHEISSHHDEDDIDDSWYDDIEDHDDYYDDSMDGDFDSGMKDAGFGLD